MNSRLGGRYQLVHEIGRGGMGRVFQAVDTETGRPVAAKIMMATGEADIQALLRFQQEGAVLSTLKHPNIVQVYGTFLEDQTCAIIMELLEGKALADLIRTEQLSLARVRLISEQVAAALVYAHGRGIVHRDIKPDNIMIVGADYVKVTDFGIARILGGGGPHTLTGMSLGTPLYMAPEQIRGHAVDGRTDIYALGAVMYQMVTGRPPFEGGDPLSIAFKHVHEAPDPPTQVAAGLPADWEAVILTALAKNPSDRFQTADQLRQAISQLSNAYGGRPAVSPPMAQTPREPWPAPLTDQTTNHPLIQPVPGQPRYVAPTAARPAASTIRTGPPERRGTSLPWIIAGAVVLAILVGGGVALVLARSQNSNSGAVPGLATNTPQATAAPTAVPAATSTQPASTPTSPAPTPTPAPVATAVPLSVDPSIIRQHGYTPDGQPAQTSDGSGHTLYAWRGTCTGSADGYCQKVFFFIDTRYLGTDTSADSTSITGISEDSPQTIAVTYANYGSNDPLCCPTGQPVTITYYWTGSKLIPSGTPPGH